MVSLAIDQVLNVSNIISNMQTDLKAFSQALHASSGVLDTSNLVLPTPDALVKKLETIASLILSLNTAKKREEGARLLRLYIFFLERYQLKLYPPATNLSVLKVGMQTLSDRIGCVPHLLLEPMMPEARFLPERFAEIKAKWKTILCSNPTRRGGEAQIRFIQGNSSTAPRSEAVQRVADEPLRVVDLGGKQLILNYPDLAYYQLGLMHVDHLQSSASLIARQQEMIEAMNFDPTFRQEVENSPSNDGYFLHDQGKVVGSYWFYMVYHNAIQNHWLLLASDNTGGGKVAEDPIIWLESFPLGQEYLAALRGRNGTISKNGLLYALSDGKSLRDSFIEWVDAHKKSFIKTVQLTTQSHMQEHASLPGLPRLQRRIRRVIARANLETHKSSGASGSAATAASTLSIFAAQHTPSSGSNSDDERNAAVALAADADYQVLDETRERMVQQRVQDMRTKRKEAKQQEQAAKANNIERSNP